MLNRLTGGGSSASLLKTVSRSNSHGPADWILLLQQAALDEVHLVLPARFAAAPSRSMRSPGGAPAVAGERVAV